MKYIFRGKVFNDNNINEALLNLNSTITKDLASNNLSIREIIGALDELATVIKTDTSFLTQELLKMGIKDAEIAEIKTGAISVINKQELYKKVKRELLQTPLELTRRETKDNQLEGYMSLGVIGHVTSSNDAVLPFLSAVEGLLTGNINIIKTPRIGSDVTISLAEKLCEICPELSTYMYVFPISSKEKDNLKLMFNCCDAIAVWGSESAVSGVRAIAPQGIQIVEWGHRISFAYVTKASNNYENLKGIATDVVSNEQQACSAPQVVYYETDNKEELMVFAQDLFKVLAEVSSEYPLHYISDSEMAELTTQTNLCKLKEVMGDGACLDGGDFRIYIENNNELTSSPLFRTVILKAITRDEIITALRPFRSYLQTVGLACETSEITSLSNLLLKAGVKRITQTGKMLEGYTGEPHDGVYALSKYVKRVSVCSSSIAQTVMDIEELNNNIKVPFKKGTKVMKKADFSESNSITTDEGVLVIKSGGSSGKAVYAPHTYSDAQMTYVTASRATISAGVSPFTDVCMNLFYCGDMYGGFISMYEALKIADITQIPMTACMDLDFVVKEIIANNVTVLAGMPSYLIKLFTEQKEALLKYNKIEKVLYGGEHFNPKQIENIKNTFGIKHIGSLLYGCNEIGTIGYTCSHCTGTQHHVLPSKYMEILKLDSDEPVETGEIGRIVLTPVDQENISVKRYEIGDLGRFIEGGCECGRLSPKFELLGRFGDTFKFATNYVNGAKIKNIFVEQFKYYGWIQIVLENDDVDAMTIRVQEDIPNAVEVLRKEYAEINECLTDKTAKIKCIQCKEEDFVLSTGGGKVCLVLERRR